MKTPWIFKVEIVETIVSEILGLLRYINCFQVKSWCGKVFVRQKKRRGSSPQCYSVEISRFLNHSDFTWNQFWGFQKCKNCHFWYFKSFEFCSFGKLQPSKSAKIHKNQNSGPLNVLKWPFWRPEIYKNTKITASVNAKMAVFAFQESTTCWFT